MIESEYKSSYVDAWESYIRCISSVFVCLASHASFGNSMYDVAVDVARNDRLEKVLQELVVVVILLSESASRERDETLEIRNPIDVNIVFVLMVEWMDDEWYDGWMVINKYLNQYSNQFDTFFISIV